MSAAETFLEPTLLWLISCLPGSLHLSLCEQDKLPDPKPTSQGLRLSVGCSFGSVTLSSSPGFARSVPSGARTTPFLQTEGSWRVQAPPSSSLALATLLFQVLGLNPGDRGPGNNRKH